MAMSPTLLRPRRRAAVPPPPIEGSAPSAPTGISLTTAPLVPTALTLATAPSPPTGVTMETGLVAPTNVGLLAAPKNLTATEVFAPDSPTGLDLTAVPSSPTGVQLSAAPGEPTSVTVASVPGSPTGVGLLGAPTNVVATESAATDPYFSDVLLLLPLTGSSGSTTFTDESNSPKSITAFGNASVTTAAADPFGNTNGILELDGAGDYLTAANSSAFDLTGDFTIECWFYADTTAAASLLSYNSSAGAGFALGPSSTAGKVWWYHNGAARILSGSTFTTGTWVHLAVVRSGTTITMWLDGSSEGFYSESKTFTAVADILIGNDQFNQDFDGKISNVRITKAARYTSNFTPPTSAFPATNGDPDFANVSLLLQDSLADESPQGQTINITGDTAVSAVESKFGGSSIRFDGSGDWLTTAVDPSLVFGTGPFTVEFWMFWDGTVTGTPFMGVMGPHNSSGTGRYGIFMSGSGITHHLQTAFPALSAVPSNQWVHIASTRDSSGTCRFFIDGVLKTTVTDTGNLTAPQGFRVGNDFSNGRPPFSGYLDSIRITTGVCRYDASFAPPTSAFPS